jgi:hypothetical protein
MSEVAKTFIEKSLGQSLLGEKVIRRREKEEKKTTNLVAIYVCHAARLQRRTGSARTSLGPILAHGRGGRGDPRQRVCNACMSAHTGE